ncbi:hypothetical protein AVEN_23839-1 [Araneus ventricosus]|uniref:Uncharacterized protein n=1 Tax=Araneus ventricosus TaxID=182803 RepID=A0A4Y2J0L1_ARAVE|nr:hypothetical protein AVEN_197569-1 [Araneus ventricosus]GBM83266.1 hypothetical protein AVEN_23839-1 [Araneus ventricosus]
MQLVLGESINSSSTVYLSSNQPKLANWRRYLVEIMVRDMRNRPPHIPTSYHLPDCLAAGPEVQNSSVRAGVVVNEDNSKIQSGSLQSS